MLTQGYVPHRVTKAELVKAAINVWPIERGRHYRLHWSRECLKLIAVIVRVARNAHGPVGWQPLPDDLPFTVDLKHTPSSTGCDQYITVWQSLLNAPGAGEKIWGTVTPSHLLCYRLNLHDCTRTIGVYVLVAIVEHKEVACAMVSIGNHDSLVLKIQFVVVRPNDIATVLVDNKNNAVIASAEKKIARSKTSITIVEPWVVSELVNGVAVRILRSFAVNLWRSQVPFQLRCQVPLPDDISALRVYLKKVIGDTGTIAHQTQYVAAVQNCEVMMKQVSWIFQAIFEDQIAIPIYYLDDILERYEYEIPFWSEPGSCRYPDVRPSVEELAVHVDENRHPTGIEHQVVPTPGVPRIITLNPGSGVSCGQVGGEATLGAAGKLS